MCSCRAEEGCPYRAQCLEQLLSPIQFGSGGKAFLGCCARGREQQSLSAPPKGCSTPARCYSRRAVPHPSPMRSQHLLCSRLLLLSPCCVFKAFISQGPKLRVSLLSPQLGSGPCIAFPRPSSCLHQYCKACDNLQAGQTSSGLTARVATGSHSVSAVCVFAEVDFGWLVFFPTQNGGKPSLSPGSSKYWGSSMRGTAAEERGRQRRNLNFPGEYSIELYLRKQRENTGVNLAS